MKILLTGNRGFLGTRLEHRLGQEGHSVTGFDIRDGLDLLNADSLKERISGCSGLVHCAVLPRTCGSNEMHSNSAALQNLLSAAGQKHIRKFIFISSVDALGIFKGESPPKYFPIDELHPCDPHSDYGMSKLLGEQLCRRFAESNQFMSLIALRPPGIWDEQTYEYISAERRSNPVFEYQPFWEYGAFIDVRDLCDLIYAMLVSENQPGYRMYHVSADDITTSGPHRIEWTQRLHPHVRWRSEIDKHADPFSTLLDNSKVKQAFTWRPRHNWGKWTEKNS